MKRIVTILVAVMLMFSAGAQTQIDNIFSKYKGKTGYTSLVMGNTLLSFISALDPDDKDLQNLSNSINGIKVLVSENNKDIITEFTQAVKADEYSEIMEVVEGGCSVKFYAKLAESSYSGFAMSVNDDKDGEQVIMHISGLFTPMDLVRLGELRGEDDYLSLLRMLEGKK